MANKLNTTNPSNIVEYPDTIELVDDVFGLVEEIVVLNNKESSDKDKLPVETGSSAEPDIPAKPPYNYGEEDCETNILTIEEISDMMERASSMIEMNAYNFILMPSTLDGAREVIYSLRFDRIVSLGMYMNPRYHKLLRTSEFTAEHLNLTTIIIRLDAGAKDKNRGCLLRIRQVPFDFEINRDIEILISDHRGMLSIEDDYRIAHKRMPSRIIELDFSETGYQELNPNEMVFEPEEMINSFRHIQTLLFSMYLYVKENKKKITKLSFNNQTGINEIFKKYL